MSQLTIQQVRSWLKSQCTETGSSCSVKELEDLEELITTAAVAAKEKAAKLQRALADFDVFTRTHGVSAEELFAAKTGRPLPAEPIRPRGRPPIPAGERNLAPPRRPFLLPNDPNTTAYSLHTSQGREWPPEIVKFLDENPEWTKDDLHYKKIAKKWESLRKQGKPAVNPWAPLTPEQKHAEVIQQLVAEGALNPSRAKKA